MQYNHTYTKTFEHVSIKELWNVWADVNNWNIWLSNIDYARMEGEFVTGNYFFFKPKGGLKFKLKLVSVVPKTEFTDCANFPLAKMYITHKFLQIDDKVEIRTHFKFTGLLACVWWRLIGAKIASEEDKQTEELLNRFLDLRSSKQQ